MLKFYARTIVLMKFAFALLLILSSHSLLHADRILNFPESAPVGFVSVSPQPSYDGPFLVFSETKSSIQRAQGKVVVPEDGFVKLELTNEANNELSVLSTLPSNAIQSLEIRGAKLTREHMLAISQVNSLIQLTLNDCQCTAEAFTASPGPPNLVSLLCYNSQKQEMPLIETWIKVLPKLESLFVSPSLTSSALEKIQDHKSLVFVNVSVEEDFPKTLIAIKNLKSLRGLQLQVTERGNNDLMEGIGKLSQLEWIRWFGGKVDTPTLVELSDLPRLNRLDLVHFEAGPGFCVGIESLKELERLEISTNNELGTIESELVKSLFELPKLKRWPTIAKVDIETFQAICRLDQIESLSFKRMSAVSAKQMKELGRLKNLVQLHLEHVDVDDDWLSCLTEMKQLEYLVLFATQVDGSGFNALGELKNLKRLRIFNARREIKLDAVAALPGLEKLQLQGYFQPPMLVPLRKSLTLKNLRLEGLSDGVVTIDDTTAEWIGECPGLSDLFLEGKLSDTAASSLAKLPAIHKLGIMDSTMTQVGILKLASIPTMQSLSVETTAKIPADLNQELRRQFPWLSFLSIRKKTTR